MHVNSLNSELKNNRNEQKKMKKKKYKSLHEHTICDFYTPLFHTWNFPRIAFRLMAAPVHKAQKPTKKWLLLSFCSCFILLFFEMSNKLHVICYHLFNFSFLFPPFHKDYNRHTLDKTLKAKCFLIFLECCDFNVVAECFFFSCVSMHFPSINFERVSIVCTERTKRSIFTPLLENNY